MKSRIAACVTAFVSVALIFTACGSHSMKIPALKGEAQPAQYAEASTPEEASQAKRLLSRSGELASSTDGAKEVSSVKELSDAFLSADTVTLKTETGKKLKTDIDAQGKTLIVSVTGGAEFDFSGTLETLRIDDCSYVKFDGTAENLIINSSGAQVRITGAVTSVFINGKNSFVLFSESPSAEVLMTNTSATLINSTESDITVCLSNGVRYLVGAGQTFSGSDITVTDHK